MSRNQQSNIPRIIAEFSAKSVCTKFCQVGIVGKSRWWTQSRSIRRAIAAGAAETSSQYAK
jgi:hypothetical protein